MLQLSAEERQLDPLRHYLEVGRTYPVPDFVERSRTMLTIASERVRAKFGFYCTGALDQLRAIEEHAAAQNGGGAVTVVAFEPKPSKRAVAVVGAGQAGLAMSYCLKQRGIDHVVIDRGQQVAEDAEAIKLLARRVPVVAFVNNHFAGYAPQTVRELLRQLAED